MCFCLSNQFIVIERNYIIIDALVSLTHVSKFQEILEMLET